MTRRWLMSVVNSNVRHVPTCYDCISLVQLNLSLHVCPTLVWPISTSTHAGMKWSTVGECKIHLQSTQLLFFFCWRLKERGAVERLDGWKARNTERFYGRMQREPSLFTTQHNRASPLYPENQTTVCLSKMLFLMKCLTHVYTYNWIALCSI